MITDFFTLKYFPPKKCPLQRENTRLSKIHFFTELPKAVTEQVIWRQARKLLISSVCGLLFPPYSGHLLPISPDGPYACSNSEKWTLHMQTPEPVHIGLFGMNTARRDVAKWCVNIRGMASRCSPVPLPSCTSAITHMFKAYTWVTNCLNWRASLQSEAGYDQVDISRWEYSLHAVRLLVLIH